MVPIYSVSISRSRTVSHDGLFSVVMRHSALLHAKISPQALQRTTPGVDDLKLPLIVFSLSVKERELENHFHYVRVQVSPPRLLTKAGV